MNAQSFRFLKGGPTNWGYVVILILITILVAGGILGYSKYVFEEMISLSKLPEIGIRGKIKDETANWKSYRNEKYKYEVGYPKDWSPHEFNKEFVSFTPPGEEPTLKYPGEIILVVYPTLADVPNNEEKLELNDWIEKETGIGSFKNKKGVQIGLGNYEGVQVESLGILNTLDVFVTHSSRVYNASIGKFSPQMSIFYQMLSTFRFLE